MTFSLLRPSRVQIIPAALVISCLLSSVHTLAVDTPHAISECETVKLSWAGDYSPFTLHILFSQNNSLIQEFANVSANSVVWQAAVPAGTMLYLEVFDSNSAHDPASYSLNVTVLPGNDACLQSSGTGSRTDTSATAAHPSYTNTGGSSSTSSSSTVQHSDSGAANAPEREPSNTLSTGAIAGIAIACLATGFLIALVVVRLSRRREKDSRSPRIPASRRQLSSYNYPKPPKSDDGRSMTTPRSHDSDELGLHPQSPSPGRDNADSSGDLSLGIREEKTLSPSQPTDHPAVTRQAVIHRRVAVAQLLSSHPPPTLPPGPSPIPTVASTHGSGMCEDSLAVERERSRPSTLTRRGAAASATGDTRPEPADVLFTDPTEVLAVSPASYPSSSHSDTRGPACCPDPHSASPPSAWTLLDTGTTAARLSTSTSTPPPSYHTRHSDGSVYMTPIPIPTPHRTAEQVV